MKVSAVLIVKNEEERLLQCLESLTWVSEIIIVDSGSSDNTLAIAKKFTDKVFLHSEWKGFGKQRQLAQKYASSEWIFAIDADEIVTEELKLSILNVVAQNDQQFAYAINRKNWAFGKFINYSGWNPDWVIRLYPNHTTSYDDALVHEAVVITSSMQVKQLKGRLLHYTYDNLYDYNTKVSKYLKAWADQRESNKTSSIFKGLTHGLFAFIKMFFLRLGFLDGRHGFILAFLSGYTTSLKYFDLWLRKHDGTQ